MSSPITETRPFDFFSFDEEEPVALDSPVIPDDLRAALHTECWEGVMPLNLFNNSFATQPESILSRETNLFKRLTFLSPHQPQNVRELQDFYKYQTALVETDRYRSLMLDEGSVDMKNLLNQFYDQELGLIIERVEASVTLLEQSIAPDTHAANAFGTVNYLRAPGVRTRSLLSKPAVRLMEQWYRQHSDHPYPNSFEVDFLAREGSISTEQVKKWFANKRNRSANTRTLTQIASIKRKRSQMY